MEGSREPEVRDALAKQILDVLYTVRNNAFHGGKRGDDANDHQVAEQALLLLTLVVESLCRTHAQPNFLGAVRSPGDPPIIRSGSARRNRRCRLACRPDRTGRPSLVPSRGPSDPVRGWSAARLVLLGQVTTLPISAPDTEVARQSPAGQRRRLAAGSESGGTISRSRLEMVLLRPGHEGGAAEVAVCAGVLLVYKGPRRILPFYAPLHFSCKTPSFWSGRCWVRTSDLCRVKSVRWFARGFSRLQNYCK
jgi:hypothetical protein